MKQVAAAFAGVLMLAAAQAPVGELAIVRTSKGSTDYGRPLVWVTVKNEGSRPAYNVSCTITAFKESAPVDTGFVRFKEGRAVVPGESVYGAAILFHLEAPSQYDSLAFALSGWEK